MPKTLYNAISPRGASMGRPNNITEQSYPVKFRMEKLRWVDGDYDQDGAYWGNSGGTDIYHAWGDAENEEQEIFVRATNRQEAKNLVLKVFSQAKFYR